MIYLDNGATSFPKPDRVRRAVMEAMVSCANPGRGGHRPAMEAAKRVYRCRETAASLFECLPEQVVLTSNCTHGLNIAIRTLVKPGGRVVISGFEHNAVTRPLQGIGANVTVAGRRLFDWENTLEEFEKALAAGADAAVFTHVSNVFGYRLPAEEMAAMCRTKGIPFVLDAAQSAGSIPISLKALGADFIAMPGHKGLQGPMGTGLLLCGSKPAPLLMGGTGSDSLLQDMPEDTPERAEAGTVNLPGIAGLDAGMEIVKSLGPERIGAREEKLAHLCGEELKKLGFRVFMGPHQTGVLSFLPEGDCEELAEKLGKRGLALRAGLHCAPLAHESAGTIRTGTLRASFGIDGNPGQIKALLREIVKVRAGDF